MNEDSNLWCSRFIVHLILFQSQTLGSDLSIIQSLMTKFAAELAKTQARIRRCGERLEGERSVFAVAGQSVHGGGWKNRLASRVLCCG